MAGLWSVRKFRGCTHRRDVPPPCGRAPGRALFSGHRGSRFHGSCVGRPAVLDTVGWGTPPPTSPRAADRSGRRAPPPGLCVGAALRRACTERVRDCPPFANLAEKGPRHPGSITALTTEIEGAWGALGERNWGAFRSQSWHGLPDRRLRTSLSAGCELPGRGPPAPVPNAELSWPTRAFGATRACSGGVHRSSQGRTSGSTSGSAVPPRRVLHGSMVPSSYGALVVHSLWRRRCGGWWDGAAPQLWPPSTGQGLAVTRPAVPESEAGPGPVMRPG